MFHFFKPRVHEPIALSIFLASAMTMQIAWMANWLVYRSPWIRQMMTINETMGPISGLYLKSFVAFIFLFGFFTFFFRGKDVSAWRERIVWFFCISVLMFIILTLPPVFEFSISAVSSSV